MRLPIMAYFIFKANNRAMTQNGEGLEINKGDNTLQGTPLFKGINKIWIIVYR